VRRLLLTLVTLAVIVYVSLPSVAPGLPPPAEGLSASVRGVVHVHTRRSDGTGTVAEVARAAARAGLQFVILSDHGDAARNPEPPAYHDGVLVIDAVEISTDGGHVVALDLPKAPYPLAGEPRDVVEDVARFGGFAIAAHPSSAKPELAWTDWSVPVDGLEYINGDSEWRGEGPLQLGRVLLAYPVRPVEAIALLFDRDEEVLRRWDALTRERRVVALAATDAHARVALPGASDPYTGRFALPLPGYESVFRALSVSLPHARLAGDAAVDARAVVDEIRAGRLFSSIDAIGGGPLFSFTATSGSRRAVGGEVLAVDGPVRVEVQAQAPPDAQIDLIRDGVQLLEVNGSSLQYDAESKPAVYRVEVRLPGAPGQPAVPWIVSNPIYVGQRVTDPRPVPVTRSKDRFDIYTDGPVTGWSVEHSEASEGAFDVVKAVSGTQVLLRYAIAGVASSHPFAALVMPAGAALPSYDRLTFTARSDRPMRLSVQLRAPGINSEGERWHRSVFVDSTAREISILFNDMTPRGRTRTPRPPLGEVRFVLFVIDTVNTPAGTAGRLSLDNVRYER
jgi:hypothetical protein